VYSVYELNLHTRSILYNIEPIGLGTGQVESLSSYLIRVAYEHNITVGHLFNKMVFPHMNKNYLERSSNYGGNRFYEGAKTINGYMENAIELVGILEKLTSRNDLSNLTLLKLKKFISLRNLLKDSLAWCPDCIENWISGKKVIYYPLIWLLKPIKICKEHNRFLIDRCHVCNRTVDILRRQMIPGYCPNCYSILSIDNERRRINQTEMNWEIFVYENMEDLLMINPKQIDAQGFKRTFIKKLNFINEEYFKNSIVSFSRYLNTPKSTLRCWLNGINFPSLDNVLKVCFKLNKNILDLLLKSKKLDANIFQINDKQVINNKTNHTRKPLNYDVIEKKLIELSTMKTPLSMNSVAKILGRDRRVLYRNFPDLCKQISKQYNDYIKERSEQRIDRLKEQIKTAFNQLTSKGIYPSRRKIEEKVNKIGVLKERVLQDYWKVLLIQSGYEEKKGRKFFNAES
jgi:hypothetical protein